MNQPTSLTIPLTGDDAIACPSCGSVTGLHFDEVSLIDPSADVVALHADGTHGLSVVTATIGDGTPPRRHQIVLPHWCSECGERGELTLRHLDGRTVGVYRDRPSAN